MRSILGKAVVPKVWCCIQIFAGIGAKQYWVLHELFDGMVFAPALCVVYILLGCSPASGSYAGHNLSAAALLMIM